VVQILYLVQLQQQLVAGGVGLVLLPQLEVVQGAVVVTITAARQQVAQVVKEMLAAYLILVRHPILAAAVEAQMLLVQMQQQVLVEMVVLELQAVLAVAASPMLEVAAVASIQERLAQVARVEVVRVEQDQQQQALLIVAAEAVGHQDQGQQAVQELLLSVMQAVSVAQVVRLHHLVEIRFIRF
jgi:hypothetical protein